MEVGTNRGVHPGKLHREFVGGQDKNNVCNYCHTFGHWKNECPMLKVNSNFPPAKPVAVAVSALSHSHEKKICAPCGPTFTPFITECYVGLLDSVANVFL